MNVNSDTLADRAASLDHTRYRELRSRAGNASQLRQIIATLCTVLGRGTDIIRPQDVRPQHVAQCVAMWEADGLAASTINRRLGLMGALGVTVDRAHWRTVRLPLKWWLTPVNQDRLLSHCRASPAPFRHAETLADYVEFISHTGLRVEEALRLTWDHVVLSITEDGGSLVSNSEITVPGTKTSGSHATLALALLPSLLLTARREASPDDTHVFNIGYQTLNGAWGHAREFLGVADNPLATLKALRRTAARNLTVKGMPTEMLRSYLRHSKINTTMGYLRLVGGYTTQEQRRFL